MESNPSTIISFIATSLSLFTLSFDAVGLQSQLAINEPYNVVTRATDIAGPILDASSRFLSMLIRPISVPIIPHAGPNSAHFSQNAITFLCLSSIQDRLVSMMPRTSSGSVPSTTSITPFFIKSSSISLAASSNASKPSFLATFERSMIFLIVSAGSSAFSLKVSVIPFSPLMKSGNLCAASTPEIEPPTVMMIDAESTMFFKASNPPLLKTPNTNITAPSIIPAKDAISISSTCHPC